MRPLKITKEAPCGIGKKKFKKPKHRKCKMCNKCIFLVKIHKKGLAYLACTY